MPAIPYDDLEAALHWVSSSAPFTNAAYISKTDGRVYYHSSSHFAADDELPDDYEDAAAYWSVPHKNDLDLGRDLVERFTDQRFPESSREVHDIFRHRGAYSRFKSLLQRLGLLDDWYAYERAATQAALLDWARENGLSVELSQSETAPEQR